MSSQEGGRSFWKSHRSSHDGLRGLPGPRLKKFGSSKSVKRKSLGSLGERTSSPPQRHDIAADLGRRHAILRPRFHQLTALGDHVGAAMGPLDLSADGMGQADLDGVGAMCRLLMTPIGKARAKAIVVTAAWPKHCMTHGSAIVDSPVPGRLPTNTKSLPSWRGSLFNRSIATGLSGTRCSRCAFIRAAGTTHVLSTRYFRPPSAKQALHRYAPQSGSEISARAAVPSCWRSSAMNCGNSR